ncbi:MAG TPA: NAD(P)-dependent oxidoreductase [Ferruginibacter sp.]|nr:NAD(P)-dependent oxidoreductase [Ferruginibacter sp.]HRO17436.1 NAD(P)-dependent oxidoreductase [Ferruginibacter sp.]HRQ21009.1 NAD(P)-dependent oxidoreductase [Ferruginibacter sp.]
MKIGLIREGKVPTDNRVALTPSQCRWLKMHHPQITVLVQPSPNRCFSDREYLSAGVELQEDLSDCDILFGIKEVPVHMLIEGKTYLFFSHTKKLQPYNQGLLQAIIRKRITLIDYECLEHNDGARIIGFGFFAGIVGAHNGMRAYGLRTGAYTLPKVNSSKNLQYLIHTYFGLKLPNIKIAVTGSGRVAHGLLEIMNLLGIHEVEPDDYLEKDFEYPVFVHLKGADLYEDAQGTYHRNTFHTQPQTYSCTFPKYIPHTDILMNGIYWDKNIPRLFEMEDLRRPDFRIQTIADVTDDMHGSVPCNLGDSTIEDPVYGVDKETFTQTAPYLPGSVDVMAVGNLPNELPRDASRYFGEQLIKHVLADLFKGGSEVIRRATIVQDGKLTPEYEYMKEYAGIVE